MAAYPALIILNLVLRMAWSIKLSLHIHTKTTGSAASLWMEIAEIVRRWLWVFVRVEWESIKKAQAGDAKVHVEYNSGDEVDYELIGTMTTG